MITMSPHVMTRHRLWPPPQEMFPEGCNMHTLSSQMCGCELCYLRSACTGVGWSCCSCCRSHSETGLSRSTTSRPSCLAESPGWHCCSASGLPRPEGHVGGWGVRALGRCLHFTYFWDVCRDVMEVKHEGILSPLTSFNHIFISHHSWIFHNEVVAQLMHCTKSATSIHSTLTFCISLPGKQYIGKGIITVPSHHKLNSCLLRCHVVTVVH